MSPRLLDITGYIELLLRNVLLRGQVCGTAAAAVTQQVAMHCHERGKLLSSVWNLSVGLMEFEAESLRKQIDAVTEESLNRNVRREGGGGGGGGGSMSGNGSFLQRQWSKSDCFLQDDTAWHI